MVRKTLYVFTMMAMVCATGCQGDYPATGALQSVKEVVIPRQVLLAEAEIPNEHGRLRPGAFAEAEIVTEVEERAVFVPASVIVTFAGFEKVLTVQAGMSVEKHMQTRRRVGDRVEIVVGLGPDELVVVEPGTLVRGQPVTVLDARCSTCPASKSAQGRPLCRAPYWT